jgi:hypothetical protein
MDVRPAAWPAVTTTPGAQANGLGVTVAQKLQLKPGGAVAVLKAPGVGSVDPLAGTPFPLRAGKALLAAGARSPWSVSVTRRICFPPTQASPPVSSGSGSTDRRRSRFT